MRKIGQAAVEVISYAIFFLLTLLFSLYAFYQLQFQEISKAQDSYTQEFSYKIAENINFVFSSGNNSWYSFPLPPNVLGKDYYLLVSFARPGFAGQKETGFVYVNLKDDKNTSKSAILITSAINFISSQDIGLVSSTSNLIRINSSIRCLNVSNNGGILYLSKGVSC